MKLGKSGPKFRTDHITSLWESKIPDTVTLRRLIPGSVLVALDVESSNKGMREIGFAMLRSDGNAPHFSHDLQFFYDQNKIAATTIIDHGRETRHSNLDRYGDTVIIRHTDEDANLVVEKMLSKYQGQNLILMGFDMYKEFEWISNLSERCPSLASSFTGWVDLEDVTLQRCRSKSQHIILSKTLEAMQIENSSPGNHSPANDAVRCLAVLSGLVSVASFPLRIETFTLPSGVTLLYRLPQLRDCGPHTKYPFSARVTTVDGGVLPSGYKTPYSLAQLFARYELVAVGLNCQKYRISQKGVRFWWFSFPNREVLDRFTSEVHGMTLHDEELIVI